MDRITAPISVIIPCYNCGETIERALDSVYQQSFLPQEVILINDCSTDNTYQELLKLKEKYPHEWVKIRGTPCNSGPSRARNIGWETASGEYIAFLDGDDTWHNQKIEIQYKIITSSKSDVHVVKRKLLNNGDCQQAFDLDSISYSKLAPKRILFFNLIPTTGVLLKKSLPYRFNEKKRRSEDYLLWLELLFSGYKFSYTPIALSYTFKADFGAGGLSGDLWKMEREEIDNFLKLREKNLISLPLLLSSILFSLTKFLRRTVIYIFQRK